MIKAILSAILRGGDKQRLMQFKSPTIIEVTASKDTLINPEHYRQYSGLVDWNNSSVLHPLYLQMISFGIQMECLIDRRNPFPLLGLVHISNKVWQNSSIDPQVRILLEARLGELKAHTKGWVINVTVEGAQKGHCVYRATGEYLIRINAPHVAKGPRKQKGDTKRFWESYHHIASWQIPDNIGREYAKVSKDYNPIHLSAVSAKMFGFKQAIAHGMWSLAKCYSQLADENHEAENIQLNAEFLKPILLPSACMVLRNDEKAETQFALLSADRSQPHIRGSIING